MPKIQDVHSRDGNVLPAAIENPSSRSPTQEDHKTGRTIRRFRRQKGLTLKELAAAVGVTGVQLHRYEVGASRIAASRLLAIADALQIAPVVLMGEAPEQDQPATVTAAPPPCPDQLVELVELYGTINDKRRRDALLAFTRSLIERREDSEASPPSRSAA